MGHAKRLLDELQSLLYSRYDNKFVCHSCVTEEFLSSQILKFSSGASICSYCGKNGAANLNELCQLIQEAIYIDWADPAEELPYDSREGGYQGTVLDGNELVQEHLLKWTDDDDLLVDVAESFGGSYLCRRDYFGLGAGEVLNYGWEDFQNQIKHVTRFLFFSSPNEMERMDMANGQSLHPSLMLERLGSLINSLELYVELQANTEFVRGRVVAKDIALTEPVELGSPPLEFATLSNRMSAPGISDFYAAFDKSTATLETFDPDINKGNTKIVFGTFINLSDMILLDLTALPPVPSAFDPSIAGDRELLVFLTNLVAEFTKPIERNNRTHIEYVPTQVFTEYIKHKLRTPKGKSIDGIKYRSSRPGGNDAVVLFVDSDACCSDAYLKPQRLKLTNIEESNPQMYLS